MTTKSKTNKLSTPTSVINDITKRVKNAFKDAVTVDQVSITSRHLGSPRFTCKICYAVHIHLNRKDPVETLKSAKAAARKIIRIAKDVLRKSGLNWRFTPDPKTWDYVTDWEKLMVELEMSI